MSNARKPKAQPGIGKGLAAYRAEAKGEPFRLPLDDADGSVLEISRPTGDALLDAEDAMNRGSSRDAIAALAGDKADEFLEAVGSDDMSVLRAVVADMQEFFGLGN